MHRHRKVRYLAILGAAATLATILPGGASSHREAPLITEDPVADNTDVYAFVSPDDAGKVTLISNWIPFEEPAGGPNFYNFGEDVLYQVHVDNDGDAEPDITYEWRFDTQIRNPDTFLYNTGPIESIDDPDFNYRQFYTLSVVRENGQRTVLGSGLPVPPNNIGPRSTPNYEALAQQGIRTVANGIKSFAGQRDEGFYVDIAAPFDLLGLRPFNPLHKIPLPAEPGVDTTGGFNVHSVALQVPKDLLTAGGDGSGIIGVYSQTKRRQVRVLSSDTANPMPRMQGDFVNVSRLGNPLINEVIIPLGKKDAFNASEPRDDAQFLPFVLNPEPANLIEALYPIDTPNPTPRQDLATIFLTGLPGLNKPPNVKPSEMIRLNTGIAPSAPAGQGNKLGVIGGDNAGYPNGRRVEDDVVDIELRALAGATPLTPDFNRSPNNLLGDGVNDNDRGYRTSFPYLASPWPGYGHERDHHKVGSLQTQPAGPGPAPTTSTSTPGSTTTTAPGGTTTTTAAPGQIPGCVIPRPQNLPPGFTLPELPPGCRYV